jgi:hypothetical protein
MSIIKNNTEHFVLSFKNDYDETQYIKSYVYKHIYKNIDNTLKYKTYIYLTKNIEEAKIWKKRNGAFRMCRALIAPTLNIPFESMTITPVTNNMIRMAKILELGLLD